MASFSLSPGLNVAFVYGFFIGSSNDSLIQTQVVEESRKYDDTIHFDVSETRRNDGKEGKANFLAYEETGHTKPIINHRKKISSLFLTQRFSQWQFGNTAANIYI